MKKHDMVVVVTVPKEDVRLSEERAVVLFDCVRELLMNSWKHSGTREAAITMAIEAKAVRVEVRDQGRGFDIRATESSSTVASHFGLASIRERVASLGGSVQIESVPGDGTRCVLLMPFNSPTRTWIGPGFTGSHNGHPVPPIPILLVDDHTMMRQGLRATLESHADLVLVGEAADGEDALALVDELRPTVVVMDMHLPRLNGVEATARIKARHADVKIIGLTVSTDPEYQEAMIDAGADLVLTKEAAVEELCHAIRRAVAGSAASCT